MSRAARFALGVALGATNGAGGISAQDLRDMLVSCLGVYGSLSVFEAAIQQDNPDTGAILTAWDTNGPYSGTTPDHTTNGITIGVTGVYEVHFCATFQGTASSVVHFRLRVDGVEQSFGVGRKISAGGDEGAAGFAAQLSLTAGEVVSIYVEMDGATDDITVETAQLTVRMIG